MRQEILERVIANYDKLYARYKSIAEKKTNPPDVVTPNMKYEGCIFQLDSDEKRELIELANEGIPEAIFDVLNNLKARRNELEGFTIDVDAGAKKLLPGGEFSIEKYVGSLIGKDNIAIECDGTRKIKKSEIAWKSNMADLIKEIEQEKLSKKGALPAAQTGKSLFEQAQKRWNECREAVFCGPTGIYEEGSSFAYIKEKIIPIATKDIWESLYNFFTNPDSCVPKADRLEFIDIYSKKLATNEIKAPKPEKEKKAASKKKKKSLLEHIAEFETSLLTTEENDWLIQSKKAITAYTLAERFVVYKKVYKGECSKTDMAAACEGILVVVDAIRDKELSRFFTDVPPSDDIWEYVVDFYKRMIQRTRGPQMERLGTALTNMLPAAIRKGDINPIGMWIGYLDKLDMLADNFCCNEAFWLSLSLDFIPKYVYRLNVCTCSEMTFRRTERFMQEFYLSGDGAKKGIATVFQSEIIREAYETSEASGWKIIEDYLDSCDKISRVLFIEKMFHESKKLIDSSN